MPIRRLPDSDYTVTARPVCSHTEHNPPQLMALDPGVYEHTCPNCHAKTIFRVDSCDRKG